MNNVWLGIFIASFVSLLIVSCKGEDPQKPENLIKESKYIDLLVELQLVRSYGENARVDSLTVDSLTKEVFKKYEISGQTFQESHTYYQQFPQQQKVRIEKAIERLKMDQIAEQDTAKVDTTVSN